LLLDSLFPLFPQIRQRTDRETDREIDRQAGRQAVMTDTTGRQA
jgi:hypothetical protein